MKLIYSLLTVLIFFAACTKETTPDKPAVPGVDHSSLHLNGKINSTDSFTVNFSGAWTISINPLQVNWVALSVTTGTGPKMVLIQSILSNTSLQKRSAQIIVTPASGSAEAVTIQIEQDAYPFEPWVNTFGGTNSDLFTSVIATADNEYIAVGSTFSTDGIFSTLNGRSDGLIVKTDAAGNRVWQKLIGTDQMDYARSVFGTADGGYLVAGQSVSTDIDYSSNVEKGYGWVIKLDSAGNENWRKLYDDSVHQSLHSMHAIKTGGYLLTGGQENNAWVIRIDENGNQLWQKQYGRSGHSIAESVCQTTDGNFVVAAYSDATSGTGDAPATHGSSDVWLFKIDPDGNLLWSKVYGGDQGDGSTGISSTVDGGVVVSAHSNSANGDVTGAHGLQDAWVIKVAGDGQLQWQKTFGNDDNDLANAITNVPGGGYVITGYTNGDAWVLRISETGQIMSQTTFGGSSSEYGQDIVALGGGKYVAVGTIVSHDGAFPLTSGDSDAWIAAFKE